ncbi:hypothetical protein D9757_004145 [Collybiopsis confluens]|uniref:Uncharacterized protein n=1 Tax=Collybiopsis confluens TaxID=2823264 RepID=A0A8H5HU30_9AGAR|nr:hypothetical protein D9757_004145 [Collybiopsis confluens]
MRVDFKILALSILAPAVTWACEGPCIVNVTNGFISKYQTPIKSVLRMADQLLTAQFPENLNCTSHLQHAYSKVVYNSLELAIFPSYFHGKCQQPTGTNGSMIDPPGCPNPDCPVVCGTPGSMVHFYPDLRHINFQTHVDIFNNITERDSEGFKAVETCLWNTASSQENRSSRSSARSPSRLFAARFPPTATDLSKSFARSPENKCETQGRAQLQDQLYNFFQTNLAKLWSDECDEEHDFRHCSWEKDMKALILSFP